MSQIRLGASKTYSVADGVNIKARRTNDEWGEFDEDWGFRIHDIPEEFSKESKAEALVAGPPNPKGREDLTTIPLVTIDDEDARDFDDAVWAEPDKSQENSGGWNLITAIADVSSYVKAGQALDKEAQKRGNSVYLPSKVIPMLPESLSNEWCSLKPNETRACIAVRVCVSKTGEIKFSSVRVGVGRRMGPWGI